MKVLSVHNFYQSFSPSGEDMAYRNETDMLRSKGRNIIAYERYNDELTINMNRIKEASSVIWSRRSYREIKSLIKKEKPNIAHFHNIWYLISPSAYYACKDSNVPVIQTLHNFRCFCVNGLLMREGKVCTKCVGYIPWNGIMYGCFRSSKLLSMPIAISDMLHKVIGTWKDKIDTFIALSEFSKKIFIDCGLPREKIIIKPNFLRNPPKPKYVRDQSYAVYSGRLSVEKGVEVLLDAFNILKISYNRQSSLKIVGAGPLRKQLEFKVMTDNIEFTGYKDINEYIDLLKGANFVIIPSLCYENFPMTLCEAFACGKPVIASRLGAMAELINDGKTGLLFIPGDPEDLALKINWMIDNIDAQMEMGKNARAEFEAKYSADKNFNMLVDLYEKTIERDLHK